MKLPYNTPIETTKEKYDKIMSRYSGICAGREEGGRYYIMLWIVSYRNEIKKLLN